MIKGAIGGGLLALVAVATLVMIVRIAASSDLVDITDLEVGQCFDLDVDDPDEGDAANIDLVDVVPCDQPHTAQAVLVGELNPDRDQPYPDDDELFARADARCAEVPPDPRFAVVSIVPTRSTWNGRSGRFVCVAVPFGLEPIVGDHDAVVRV